MSANVGRPCSLRVAEYCETFDRLREQKEKLAVEDTELLEEALVDIWNLMTVEECREVELRYPELRIERI